MNDHESDLARIIREKSRLWLGYWNWADKPVTERGALRVCSQMPASCSWIFSPGLLGKIHPIARR